MDSVVLSNEFEKVKNSQFVLYGASSGGVSCFEYMKKIGLDDQIVCFVDSNPAKHGTYLCNKKIRSANFLKKNPNLLILVSSGFFGSVYESIRRSGCSNLVYVHIPTEPLYTDEIFLADVRLIESYYDASDEYSKMIIRSLVFLRDRQNCRIQPIENVVALQAVSSYWYDKMTLNKYDALTICDLGAFDGDTLKQLHKDYGEKIKRYYAFEPDGKGFQRLLSTIATLDIEAKVTPCNFGLSDENTLLRFNDSSEFEMSHRVSEDGETTVQIKKIDDTEIDVEGKLCIKMDIEGFEMNALRGARETIEKHLPDLAICVYHRVNDVFKIPEYIKSINPKYNCILRGGNHMVCYASCNAK